ncbi:MAG: S41 family peptidase [Lachnospiraceae bacterium]|nr:S41 family peptidase [Lachnospiraceae bacterium]
MDNNNVVQENEKNVVVEEQAVKPEKPKKKGRLTWSGVLLGILIGILLMFIPTVIICLVNILSISSLSARLNNIDSTIVTQDVATKLDNLDAILNAYYYEDVDKEAEKDALYYGIMESVGDPYTCYYNEEEIAQLYEDLAGKFEGIGAYIHKDIDADYCTIQSLIPNSPAAESELEPDDIIIKVDGTDTYGMTLNEVVSMIRGDEGTSVVLTVKRGDEEKEITIVRAKVETVSATYESLDNGIGLITITEFNDNTYEFFKEAKQQFIDNGDTALILDLRGNPGGNLDTVVNIAQEILPQGLVVYTEDKYGKREEYKCDGKKEMNVPIVVLVDGSSASASEILAGAIKDHNKGTLIGTTTFGKGIVQKLISLSDGTAVKITVSKYYTPNGANIHGTGIEPDIEVEFDADAYTEDGTDNQMEAAIEYLTK